MAIHSSTGDSSSSASGLPSSGAIPGLAALQAYAAGAASGGGGGASPALSPSGHSSSAAMDTGAVVGADSGESSFAMVGSSSPFLAPSDVPGGFVPLGDGYGMGGSAQSMGGLRIGEGVGGGRGSTRFASSSLAASTQAPFTPFQDRGGVSSRPRDEEGWRRNASSPSGGLKSPAAVASSKQSEFVRVAAESGNFLANALGLVNRARAEEQVFGSSLSSPDQHQERTGGGDEHFSTPGSRGTSPPPRMESMDGETTKLFFYNGVRSSICGGSVCGGARVCTVPPNTCRYKHVPKLHDLLAAGYYIKSPSGNGASIFKNPTVSRETADASLAFTSIKMDRVGHGVLVHLMEAANKGTLDDGAVEDIQGFVAESGAFNRGRATTTPGKRMKLIDIGEEDGSAVDAFEGGDDLPRWAKTEDAFREVDLRVSSLEGLVGKPGAESNDASLWGGMDRGDGRMMQVEKYLADTLEGRLVNINNEALTSHSVAKRALNQAGLVQAGAWNAPVDDLKLKVATVERDNQALLASNQNLAASLEQTIQFVMGVVEGRIPIQGGAPPPPFQGSSRVVNAGVGQVSTSDFETYKASIKRSLTVLENQVKGGSYSVLGTTFQVTEDSVSYYMRHFPPDSWECITGIMSVFQVLSKKVVTTEETQTQELHESKVQRSHRQTSMIASFATTYPHQLGGPKAGGTDKGAVGADFSSMASYEQWDADDGIRGLRNTLAAAIEREQESITSHINTILEGHPFALSLCIQLLTSTTTWWTWFQATFGNLYRELLNKACPGTTCSKEMKATCWKVATGALRTFFDELRAVRVSASGAHLAGTPAKRGGLFLHATLQEHRILKEFMTTGFKQHPKVQEHLVQHVFDTYLPRAEVSASNGSVKSLQIKYGELESKFEGHVTSLGSLRADGPRVGPGVSVIHAAPGPTPPRDILSTPISDSWSGGGVGAGGSVPAGHARLDPQLSCVDPGCLLSGTLVGDESAHGTCEREGSRGKVTGGGSGGTDGTTDGGEDQQPLSAIDRWNRNLNPVARRAIAALESWSEDSEEEEPRRKCAVLVRQELLHDPVALAAYDALQSDDSDEETVILANSNPTSKLSPAHVAAGGTDGSSAPDAPGLLPVRPSLWTGRMDPVRAPHAATGLIQGFRPRDRQFRGWCEVRCSSPHLWSVAAPALGFPVRSIRTTNARFVSVLRAAGSQAKHLGQGSRPGFRADSLNVSIVFGDVASMPAWTQSAYWAHWRVPHVFHLKPGVEIIPPSGWSARRSSFEHWRLGGSTTARWDLGVWYPPGGAAPNPVEVPDQPWIPLSGRIDKQIRSQPHTAPPPAGAPRPFVCRVEGEDVIRTNGLFPADTLDQRVWLPDDRSPTKFGRRSLAWKELCDLWDVPISVVDQAAKDESDMVLLRSLFDSPPAKFLELGADALLIGFGRGGVAGKREREVEDPGGLETPPALKARRLLAVGCVGRKTALEQGDGGSSCGSTASCDSDCEDGSEVVGRWLTEEEDIVNCNPPKWPVDTTLFFSDEPDTQVLKQDGQKADDAAVPTHIWSFFFRESFMARFGQAQGRVVTWKPGNVDPFKRHDWQRHTTMPVGWESAMDGFRRLGVRWWRRRLMTAFWIWRRDNITLVKADTQVRHTGMRPHDMVRTEYATRKGRVE
ncbi:hypothetical protein ACHAXR_008130, partial [Thalassiosira sp. AJA248-18]